MTGQLDSHNLYRVNISPNLPSSSDVERVMTMSTSPTLTDLSTWHRQFAHLNVSYLKRLPFMTTGMKVLPESSSIPFCTACV